MVEQLQNDAKTRILMASKKLFALYGYDGTSVRLICEEANTNAALISYYFGGKENVYQALFDMYSPASILKISDDLNPIQGIRFIVQGMTRYRIEEPEMIGIIQQEVFMNSPRLKSLRQYSCDIWFKLKHFLNEGKNQGIFKFNSIDKTLFYIIAIITFPSTNPNFDYLLVGDGFNAEDAIEDTLSFILRALCYKSDNCEVS